ncbi:MULTISPECIES: hypothetical protein [unclassified Streptomyces]|uniref:hypothetical protein n=1 Tax=unclassified Streptomyces TaxID=2593676 RepID=UPI00068E2977
MAELFGAAFGFPGLILTSALAVVAGFWLLVLCRMVPLDAFDADVDREALGLGAVPVAVAGSVFVAAGWLLDLAGMLLLGRSGLPAPWSLPLSVALLAGALAASWRLTRWLAGRVRKRPAAARRTRRPGAAPGPHPARPPA